MFGYPPILVSLFLRSRQCSCVCNLVGDNWARGGSTSIQLPNIHSSGYSWSCHLGHCSCILFEVAPKVCCPYLLLLLKFNKHSSQSGLVTYLKWPTYQIKWKRGMWKFSHSFCLRPNKMPIFKLSPGGFFYNNFKHHYLTGLVCYQLWQVKGVSKSSLNIFRIER